ncbi:MFS transporter [Kribbella sandramycini]|uniref:MFS family permease n=1 Tax=Kribbella sandramycini TaxID=60450 RepID=A0A7Y4KXP7_9ACTN|nr:MFS transporter [Kribbella sandramycini]MBB6569608.1 MFS family permease [Kribbella sandramycini]NOL40558.1 MFS transporter [Kribbella sandramycini]
MRDALVLLVGGAIAELAFRFAQVALPLVVLQETGSVAATGLAGGAAGLPVLLSPWWARRARQWVDSGPRLAVVAAGSAGVLAIVPAAAGLGVLTPWLLALSGLLLGFGDALSSPGRTALLADTGDKWGEGRAVVLLTWQDGLRRVGMVIGPPIAAVAVAAGITEGLLWAEAAVVLGSGLLAVLVRAERSSGDTAAPSIRKSLTGRREVALGWIVRGTGCVTWFAFTLGLSVLGAQRGQPGVYLAAGMSGYGVGAVLGTVVAMKVVRRVEPVRLAAVSWAVVGLCWAGMGIWTHPASTAGWAAVAGVAVVWGIAAISQTITRSSSGPDRRALLSGQSVVVNACSSAGLLAGGPVIAVIGVQATLIASGLLTVFVAATVGYVARSMPKPGRSASVSTPSASV